MKNLNFILFILILFDSCNQNKDIINEKFVEKLEVSSYKTPSKYGELNLFILSSENDFIITNANYLNYVYKKYYVNSFKNFHSFLSEVLNQRTRLDKKKFDNIPFKIFKIDYPIKKEYEDNTFKYFFSKYTTQSKFEKGKLLLKQDIGNFNKTMSVCYFLYLNGYQIEFDDNIGIYYVIKRESIF
ncbi:hypothetical protein [Flavobacterium sp.]|uniref:hypothetical protein n=1 Tax=Flavobacterium sp. TaxID=239 RepID=UPI00375362B0